MHQMKKTIIILGLIILCSPTLFSQQIQVTSPNGGETWHCGRTYIIRWTSEGIGNKVKIAFIKSGVVQTPHISDSANNSDGANLRNAYHFTVPYDIEPGTNYKIAVANLAETVHDLSNGFFSIQCHPSDLPDLQVEEISLNPKRPDMGDVVEIKTKIVNNGPGYSPIFTAKLKVDIPQNRPTKTYDIRIPFLNHPDHPRNYIEIIKRVNHGAWGIYKTTVTLDLGGNVEESDEGNNEKVQLYSVNPLPDLIVCIRDGGGTYVQTNKKIWASVKNVGPKQSPPCKLVWTIEENGTDTIDVPRLDSMEETVFYKSPKWSFAKTQNIWATVDPGNTVKEIHEDNNEVAGSISVTMPPNSPPARSRKKCSNQN
jgi:hypothetical protein